jgi:ABC-2 type transport system ATP-binding protein/lipopolysaccharide transport system ATP-binding protein
MSAVAEAPQAAPATGEARLAGVGVRFDFDRLGRVVTPGLNLFRRIHSTKWGLRGVDLHVAPGSGLALIGPTGAGKTTLLRVTASVLPPDEGGAHVRGRVGSLLATAAGLSSLLTGRENAEVLGVLAGLSLEETRRNMDLVAERVQLDEAFDHPIHTYSLGMRARLGLAGIQAISPQVLLLDEVFEALDHEFRGIVEQYAAEIRDRGGIVIAAGHDHPALERICPQAAWLDDGHLRAAGPFDEVVSAYRRA